MKSNKISKVVDKIKSLIFPRNIKCIFCGDELNNRSINDTCENCINSLPFIQNACPRCGNPMNPEQTGVCLDCSRNNYYFVFCKSVFIYKDKVAGLVQRIKYNGEKFLIKSAAKYLINELSTSNISPDYVTNVPLFPSKEKERGFNQSSLLGKYVANAFNLQFVELCEKVVNNPSQTSLSISERKENVKDVYKLKQEYLKAVKNKVILVIDDVFTTGATTNEICKILVEHGARACYVLTLAHSVIDKDAFKDI